VKRILYALILFSLTSSVHAAAPDDGAAGKRLHDANCVKCHDSGVYSRKDRQVKSLDGLKQQLDNCEHATNKEFSEPDTQSLVRYLNDQFYHFR